MKSFLALASELLAFVCVGLLIGAFLDKKLNWGGWALIFCVFICYTLWFIKLYKKIT